MTVSSISDELPRDEPDQVRDQLRQLFRHRLVIATAVVLGLCGGALLAATGSGTYEADGSVLVRDVTSSAFDSQVGVDNQINMQTEIQVASSPLVTDRAATALGEAGLTGADLKHGLLVSVSPDSQVLDFAYTGAGAAETARRTNALMTAYLAQRHATATTSLARTTGTLQAQLKSLNSRYDSAGPTVREAIAGQISAVQSKLTDYETVDTTPGTVLSKAVTPASPAGAGAGLTLAVGGVVGLALGLLLAWLTSVLESGVRDEADVRRHLDAPVLATLPRRRRARRGQGPVLAVGSRSSRTGEVYRALALRVALTVDPDAGDGGRRVLLVVEPRSAGHAAEVAANLASAFAESGEDVLLIEADLREPQLSVRLARQLSGDGVDAQGRPRPPLRVNAGQPGAFFLVPGRPTRAIGPALAEIEANAMAHRAGRTIVVYAPAVLEYPDALAVARWADGIIVVCPDGGLPRGELGRVADFFEPTGTPVVGAVLRRTGGQVAQLLRRALPGGREPGGGPRTDPPAGGRAAGTAAGGWSGGSAGASGEWSASRTLTPQRLPLERTGE
ncbi:lipopolysaccharide biosynthesis protein [Streptomyces sp. SL13]|uniref:Lipopolysaccharide biosynthesis protein n=1 Tax=Streptantibioticus silvisoli TaxID=2705255 RepID=A0AA90GVW6_9ACTN|nr:lipopolysaccharide biosynthesis protein [Streptantibioticus silvisoli]MDI5969063.1 lipopolysaccharide biosynthesis protein [Streptantibioticus silvisoli]